jgi:catechol 2,3-dioxygenase-like lactoylglutathione lyase family enzyme
VSERPDLTLVGVVLDSPDPRALAAFYRDLLGWTIGTQEDKWCTVYDPDKTGVVVSIQFEAEFRRPSWPASADAQQMQSHLDIWAKDLEAAVSFAEQHGAVQAAYQPQPDVRVMLDPDGHPFCLCL